MKKLLMAVAMLGAALWQVGAQEVISREEALKASFTLWHTAGNLDDLALKVDPDIKYPFGMAKGDLGMIVVPETKVADVLAKAGEKPLPVGQLWMRGLVLEVDGSAVEPEKRKTVEIAVKDVTAAVSLFTLGIRKTEKNGLELLVFGKGKEPLKTVPFKTVKGGDQEYPIELDIVPGGNNAEVVINVLGRHEARITVRQE